MEERKSPMNVQEQKGETGVVDWKNRTAKKGICMDCGKEFIITLGEFVDKLQHGMRLPKRCKQCRTCRRRKALDPYEGLSTTFYWYPATKGHRHTVHGGGY